jgi:hypothetical protein
MSSITAPTPVLSPRPTSRTPFLVGAALIAIVGVGVVVGPRLGTSPVTTTVPYTVNEHDAIEHRAVGSTAHTVFGPAPVQSARLRASADEQGAGLVVGAPQVAQSVFDEQTSALRPYTPYIPQRTTQRYEGSLLVTVPAPDVAVPEAVSNSAAGGHQVATSNTDGQDQWVPRYKNSRWAPFITKHYVQPPTTTSPTHEYR